MLQEWKHDRIVSFLPTANVVALFAARGLGIPVIVGERMFPAFLGLGWLHDALEVRLGFFEQIVYLTGCFHAAEPTTSNDETGQ